MIKIKKSKDADSRTCNFKNVSKQQLIDSSIQHINDVKLGMRYIAKELIKASLKHDYTKLSDIDQFHKDFITDFETTTWWEMHQKTERHHLTKHIPDDVNLIDVIECLVDGVMAGLARSEKYSKEELPIGLLKKAYDNTIKKLIEEIEIVKK